MPKISVILAVYNVEKYLSQCLDSLLAQTLDDIELICVNDCSTDNSYKILNEYALKDKRIKLICTDKNSGPGITRNTALEHVTGEYIAIVDPDDWVLPDYLMNLYQKAIETGADLIETNNLLYKKGRLCKNKLAVIDFKIKKSQYTWSEMNEYLFPRTSSWGKLYKTSFIQNNKIRFSTCRSYEDNIFVIKSRILANTIYFLNKSEYIYRQRRSSLTKTLQVKPYAETVLKDVKSFLEEEGIYEDLSEYYNIYAIRVCTACAKSLVPEVRAVFNGNVKSLLGDENYTQYLENLKNHKNNNIFRWIFSLRNENCYKILVILGIKFKLFKVYEE